MEKDINKPKELKIRQLFSNLILSLFAPQKIKIDKRMESFSHKLEDILRQHERKQEVVEQILKDFENEITSMTEEEKNAFFSSYLVSLRSGTVQSRRDIYVAFRKQLENLNHHSIRVEKEL